MPPCFTAGPPPAGAWWHVEDSFGNGRGRLRVWTPADSPGTGRGSAGVDVFGKDIHCAGVTAGDGFFLVACADTDGFSIWRVSPSGERIRIFTHPAKLALGALSTDGRHLVVDLARSGNWFRPEVAILDQDGAVEARLQEVSGVAGCWAGAWSPASGEKRSLIHHEASGWLRPAIWEPWSDRVTPIDLPLEGEVRAAWDRTGDELLIHRTWEGRSDLHRMELRSGRLARIQPRDGVVASYEAGESNRAVGLWSANHRYVESFRESDRCCPPSFAPSAPLHGWIFRWIAGVPCFVVGGAGRAGQRWTIFDPYGDFSHHHADGYNWKVQCLVDHGFQVVMVNTRGCSGFGRVWREATAGRIGATELEDLGRVCDALVAEGRVDPQRTIVSGDSWGGYLALLAVGTQPGRWAMAVAGSPVTDFVRLRDEASPILWPVRPWQFGGSPESCPDAYRAASPIRYVDGVRSPVMILAGRHDLLCPIDQSIRFAEAIRARGGDCELFVYEGGHGAPDREARVRHMEVMLAFLRERCRRTDRRSGSLG